MSSSPLFAPLKVGEMSLKHRVVMAPLTRFRASDAHVPTDLMVEYYRQRSSTPGTLLITEATHIAQKAGGHSNVPGIWNEEQAKGWKKITDVVHAQGSFIYLQLWALGRSADPRILRKEAAELGLPEDAFPYVSASSVPADPAFKHTEVPRPLTETEIDEYVELFANAARSAVEAAGFDGVEIHGANSYLIDQFLQDVTNKRTDNYGGSIENRVRFPLRVVDAVVAAVGPTRTAIRVSPFNRYNGMRMSDPYPTFSHFVREVRKRHPRFAFLHVVEGHEPGDQTDFLREIWRADASASSVFLSASRHERDTALATAEKGDAVVFGRYFISNPDLPLRLKYNIPLTPFDASTFYAPKTPKGYVDYPFATMQDLPWPNAAVEEASAKDGTATTVNAEVPAVRA